MTGATVETAFEDLYGRITSDDSAIPAIERDGVLMYDVQTYGHRPWSAEGERPARDAVYDEFSAVLDDRDLAKPREDHEEMFPQVGDEVFRDRIYSPTESLHLVLHGTTVYHHDVPEMVDRLVGYADATDASILVSGTPVREAAGDGNVRYYDRRPVYADLSARVDGGRQPGETRVLPTVIRHPGDRGPTEDAVQDDHLYLVLMANEVQNGYYPVMLFNGVVTAEKRETAATLAGMLDDVGRDRTIG